MLLDTERTCALIDLNAVRNNYGSIRRAFSSQKIMTVMKADAYGHGIAGLVPVCDPLTDWYAAAAVEEAMAIRMNGGTKPVLLFGPAPKGHLLHAAEHHITLSVGSCDYAKQVSDILSKHDLTVDIQIKLDTGFNRTGIRVREENISKENDYVNQIRSILALPELRLTGVYSHLACPESDDPSDIAFTDLQVSRYRRAIRALCAEGIDTGLHHIASTGGAIAHPEYRLDMVRIGMMVYGQCDTEAHYREIGLQCALTWAARIIQVEHVKAGESVSYGRTFRAERDTRIAILSCGYADGYRRCYQHGGKAILHGRSVPVIGRICMDYTILDVTELPETRPGDEAVLLGEADGCSLSAMYYAGIAESTCGEVTGAIAARVPRRYRG